jgi:hypothetical protein
MASAMDLDSAPQAAEFDEKEDDTALGRADRKLEAARISVDAANLELAALPKNAIGEIKAAGAKLIAAVANYQTALQHQQELQKAQIELDKAVQMANQIANTFAIKSINNADVAAAAIAAVPLVVAVPATPYRFANVPKSDVFAIAGFTTEILELAEPNVPAKFFYTDREVCVINALMARVRQESRANTVPGFGCIKRVKASEKDSSELCPFAPFTYVGMLVAEAIETGEKALVAPKKRPFNDEELVEEDGAPVEEDIVKIKRRKPDNVPVAAPAPVADENNDMTDVDDDKTGAPVDGIDVAERVRLNKIDVRCASVAAGPELFFVAYTKCSIDVSLRIHPTLPWDPRTLSEEAAKAGNALVASITKGTSLHTIKKEKMCCDGNVMRIDLQAGEAVHLPAMSTFHVVASKADCDFMVTAMFRKERTMPMYMYGTGEKLLTNPELASLLVDELRGRTVHDGAPIKRRYFNGNVVTTKSTVVSIEEPIGGDLKTLLDALAKKDSLTNMKDHQLIKENRFVPGAVVFVALVRGKETANANVDIYRAWANGNKAIAEEKKDDASEEPSADKKKKKKPSDKKASLKKPLLMDRDSVRKRVRLAEKNANARTPDEKKDFATSEKYQEQRQKEAIDLAAWNKFNAKPIVKRADEDGDEDMGGEEKHDGESEENGEEIKPAAKVAEKPAAKPAAKVDVKERINIKPSSSASSSSSSKNRPFISGGAAPAKVSSKQAEDAIASFAALSAAMQRLQVAVNLATAQAGAK